MVLSSTCLLRLPSPGTPSLVVLRVRPPCSIKHSSYQSGVQSHHPVTSSSSIKLNGGRQWPTTFKGSKEVLEIMNTLRYWCLYPMVSIPKCSSRPVQQLALVTYSRDMFATDSLTSEMKLKSGLLFTCRTHTRWHASGRLLMGVWSNSPLLPKRQATPSR